jgi:hypothetical protein
MKEPFVPLKPAAVPGRNRGDFQVTIVSQADKLEAFQPLGRPAKPGSGGECEPKVTLQRDGNRVTSIRIQCTCGQVIELGCIYDKAKS